jgi:hypothetical protein
VNKLELIVSKIDDVKDTVNEISKDTAIMKLDVARNSDNLVVHMKRTELNETRIKLIEERLTISYLLKLIMGVASGLGLISGSIYGVIRLVNLLLA